MGLLKRVAGRFIDAPPEAVKGFYNEVRRSLSSADDPRRLREVFMSGAPNEFDWGSMVGRAGIEDNARSAAPVSAIMASRTDPDLVKFAQRVMTDDATDPINAGLTGHKEDLRQRAADQAIDNDRTKVLAKRDLRNARSASSRRRGLGGVTQDYIDRVMTAKERAGRQLPDPNAFVGQMDRIPADFASAEDRIPVDYTTRHAIADTLFNPEKAKVAADLFGGRVEPWLSKGGERAIELGTWPAIGAAGVGTVAYAAHQKAPPATDLSPDDVRDMQKRMGLPQTGLLDNATQDAISKRMKGKR